MLLEEAKWIARELEPLLTDSTHTVLDVGSSTEEFRRLDQPYIDYHVFRPLSHRGVSVVHVDRKAASGVDVAVDLERTSVLPNELRGRGDVVVCSNLLEHCNDRHT